MKCNNDMCGEALHGAAYYDGVTDMWFCSLECVREAYFIEFKDLEEEEE